MKARLLYVSYDGMLEPLGQSQVLAYLERLAEHRPIHLLSFEKPEDFSNTVSRDAAEARMRAAGINWHPRRYHKRPSALATSWDVGIGVLTGLWLVLRHRIGIVHARSYVPAVMALALKRMTGVKFVFDMRGFWADERVDGGLWPVGSRLYHIAKWFERRFLLSADHVVSLTHAAVAEMQRFEYLEERMPPVTVIPTCADLSRFVPVDGLRDSNHFTLGYVGSAGTWYLFDAAISVFKEVQRQLSGARFLIINRGGHTYIRERLAVAMIDEASVELREVSHADIPFQMARMDAGVFFYKPSYSRTACAPTKLGEFLGCGIPCLSNTGVGDMASTLRQDSVGIAVDDIDEISLKKGVADLLALCADPGTRTRCVASAQRHFSLEEGVGRYAAIHAHLGGDAP